MVFYRLKCPSTNAAFLLLLLLLNYSDSPSALTQYHKGKRAYKQEDIILSGWLTKESTSTGTLARVSTGSRKKRYFVLTANSIEFYRSVELQQKMGAIAFNSLCSVTLPDEKTFKEEGTCTLILETL